MFKKMIVMFLLLIFIIPAFSEQRTNLSPVEMRIQNLLKQINNVIQKPNIKNNPNVMNDINQTLSVLLSDIYNGKTGSQDRITNFITNVIVVTNTIVSNSIVTKVIPPEYKWEMITASNITISGVWKDIKHSDEAVKSLNNEIDAYCNEMAVRLEDRYAMFEPGKMIFETNGSYIRSIIINCRLMFKIRPDYEKLAILPTKITGMVCSNFGNYNDAAEQAYQSLVNNREGFLRVNNSILYIPHGYQNLPGNKNNVQFQMTADCYYIVPLSAVVTIKKEIIRGQSSRFDVGGQEDQQAELNGAARSLSFNFYRWANGMKKHFNAIGFGLGDLTFQKDAAGTYCQTEVQELFLIQ
jgi:hypothetical protein